MRIDRDLFGWGVFFAVAGGKLWPIGSLILGVVFLAASIRPGRSVD